MKVTNAHLLALTQALEPKDCHERRMQYHDAGLSDRRYRWDLLWLATDRTPLARELVEANYNDEHLDTALRSIVPTLAEGVTIEDLADRDDSTERVID